MQKEKKSFQSQYLEDNHQNLRQRIISLEHEKKELIKENSTLIKQKDDLANFLRRKIKELEDREEEIKRDGISKERISIGIPGVEKSHLVNHIKSLQVEKAKKEDEIKQQKLKLEKQNILIEEGQVLKSEQDRVNQQLIVEEKNFKIELENIQKKYTQNEAQIIAQMKSELQEIRKKALQNASTKLNKVTKELIDDTADQDEQEQRLVEKCSELKIDNQELQYHLEDLQQMLESSNQNLAIHSEINHRNNHKIANQAKIIEQFNNRIKKMKDELERDKRNLNKRLELEVEIAHNEADALRHLLNIRIDESNRIKLLAQTVLNQRSTIELCLIESLAYMRQQSMQQQNKYQNGLSQRRTKEDRSNKQNNYQDYDYIDEEEESSESSELDLYKDYDSNNERKRKEDDDVKESQNNDKIIGKGIINRMKVKSPTKNKLFALEDQIKKKEQIIKKEEANALLLKQKLEKKKKNNQQEIVIDQIEEVDGKAVLIEFLTQYRQTTGWTPHLLQSSIQQFNDQYSEVNETEIEQRNKRQFEQNNNPKLISTISPVRNNKELKDINRTQSSQDIFRRENIQGNIIREGVDQIIDDNEGSRIRAQTSFEMRPQFLRKREGHGCGPGSISRLTQFQMYLTEHENLVKERASQLGHTNSRQILYMQQLQKEVMNTRKKEKEKEDEDRVKQLIQDRDKAKAVDGVIVSGEENKDKYLFDHLAQRDFILGPNALDKEKQFIATKLSTGEKQREEEMKIQEKQKEQLNNSQNNKEYRGIQDEIREQLDEQSYEIFNQHDHTYNINKADQNQSRPSSQSEILIDTFTHSDQNKANRQYLMQKERQQMPEETV